MRVLYLVYGIVTTRAELREHLELPAIDFDDEEDGEDEEEEEEDDPQGDDPQGDDPEDDPDDADQDEETVLGQIGSRLALLPVPGDDRVILGAVFHSCDYPSLLEAVEMVPQPAVKNEVETDLRHIAYPADAQVFLLVY